MPCRSRRRWTDGVWLAGPAAAAQPPVADHDSPDHQREADEEDVLDVADVVAPQHGEHEETGEDAADLNRLVTLLRPTPVRGRHVLDVNAGMPFDLGVRHGCSS